MFRVVGVAGGGGKARGRRRLEDRRELVGDLALFWLVESAVVQIDTLIQREPFPGWLL